MEKMKVAIIGSRTFADKERLFRILDKNYDKIEMIISGGAKGADELGRLYAQERGFPCLIYYARWHAIDATYDRGAGFKRNHLIIKESDTVVAFWDGESRGTKHSLDLAKSLGKKIRIFKFQQEAKESRILEKID